MKSPLFATSAILCLINAGAFAGVPCSEEIKDAALAHAKSDGYGSCTAGDPTPGPGVQLRVGYGSIDLLCQEHISQVSVETRPITYSYSFNAGECRSVGIYDLN
jgi:hypothetical protein